MLTPCYCVITTRLSSSLRTLLSLFSCFWARVHPVHHQLVRHSRSHLRLKTSEKIHTDQMMRNRNFRVRNEVVERGSVTKSQKAYVERKVRECFQWKAHGQCFRGDSCSFSHDIVASANKGKGERRKGRSSSPASHSKAKRTDGEKHKSSQGSCKKQEKLERQE